MKVAGKAEGRRTDAFNHFKALAEAVQVPPSWPSGPDIRCPCGAARLRRGRARILHQQDPHRA